MNNITTTAQLSKHLNVPTSTITRWANNGRLPKGKVGKPPHYQIGKTRYWEMSLEELEQVYHSNLAASASGVSVTMPRNQSGVEKLLREIQDEMRMIRKMLESK